jgi:intron-binding protein aquarius
MIVSNFPPSPPSPQKPILTTPSTDILLSLVRTRSIGYLRDPRRLTVALSRARLGLYILGRASVFASCFELKPAFDVLLSRPTKLALVMDELYAPSHARRVEDVVEDAGEAVMEGVEHLGQYVFEMTKAKVDMLKGGGSGEVKMTNGGMNSVGKEQVEGADVDHEGDEDMDREDEDEDEA